MSNDNYSSNSITTEDIGVIQSKFNKFNKSQNRIRQDTRYHDENAKYFLPNDDEEIDRNI